MSHQGEGFPRKASVTLGSFYCSQDEGNGLFYSIPLCNSGGIVPRAGLVALGGTWTGWATLTGQEGEELGHQGSEKSTVDVNQTIGQGLQIHMLQRPERAMQSGEARG